MNDKLREEIRDRIDERLSEYSIHPQETHVDGCSYEDDDTTCSCDFKFEFRQYPGFLEDAASDIENLISQEVLDCLDRLSQKSLNFTVPNWQSKDNNGTATAVYSTHIEAEKLKYTKDKTLRGDK